MINIDKEIKLKIEKYIDFRSTSILALNVSNIFNLENLHKNIFLFSKLMIWSIPNLFI